MALDRYYLYFNSKDKKHGLAKLFLKSMGRRQTDLIATLVCDMLKKYGVDETTITQEKVKQIANSCLTEFDYERAIEKKLEELNDLKRQKQLFETLSKADMNPKT